MEIVRVLHILWSGHSGGAERFVRDITLYSDKKKFLHTVCFLSHGGWLADDMARHGVDVSYLGMKTGLSVAAGVRILKTIRKLQPHVIHSHGRNYLSNLCLLYFSNIPKVYYEHGGDLIGKRPHRDELFYRLFSHMYDLILVNSDHVRQKILRIKKTKLQPVKTLYIGINTEIYGGNIDKKEVKKQLGIPAERKVIGTVGRLVAQKGIDDFIKVAAEIGRMCNRCSFVVVGEGKERCALEQLAATCNVEIIFLGDRHDVPHVLGAFDILLFTPKWEPFGIVVLEALAAKVPVVGFAVGGTQEIIERCGGVLIEERDHRALAHEVINLLHNSELYEHVSQTGWIHVQRFFDIRESIAQLEHEYTVVAQRNR